MTEQEFAAGHVFFRAGDPADRAYLLHAGEVEVLAGGGGAVARFGPGDVFGEMALIEERPRGLTARATTAGRASPMTRDDFEHLLTHDPARARHYLRSLFERLRSLTAPADGEFPAAPPEPASPTDSVVPLVSAGPVELPAGPDRPAAEWAVVLHPLTPTAAENMPDDGLRVTRFPLRIGRTAGLTEPEAYDLNDLWLLDQKPYEVSRNHCEIHVDRDGPVVRDRGSHLGCLVNDDTIGGRSPLGYARLRPGDNTLRIGSPTSQYQYRVTVSHA